MELGRKIAQALEAATFERVAGVGLANAERNHPRIVHSVLELAETPLGAGDAAIVGLGCDRSVHGGASEKKEIDPNNRGSILIGCVAFYLDRYGYDVLPLALRMLRGESVPGRTLTRHTLITTANVWREYPPYDMQ